jgi:hypothetical protein
MKRRRESGENGEQETTATHLPNEGPSLCNTRPVPSVTSMTEDEFTAYMHASRPVVIQGAMTEGVDPWPASRTWTADNALDHLSQFHAESMVEVESSLTTSSFYGDERFVEPVEMSFGDLLRCMGEARGDQEGKEEAHTQNRTNYYLNQCPLESVLQAPKLPHLMADVRVPAFLPVCRGAKLEDTATSIAPDKDTHTRPHSHRTHPLAEANLWATQHLSRTNWHYDTWNNCLCLVRGRKELLLCAPVHGHRLKPHPVFAVMPNHCRLTLPLPTGEGAAPDDACGCQPAPWAPCPPSIRDVPLWRVTLEAGDMLYLPPGWWHQVNTQPIVSDPLALTLAVNFWWGTRVNADSVSIAGSTVHEKSAVAATLADGLDPISEDLFVVREALVRLRIREQVPLPLPRLTPSHLATPPRTFASTSTCTRTHTHTHARTHAHRHTDTHTHTQKHTLT